MKNLVTTIGLLAGLVWLTVGCSDSTSSESDNPLDKKIELFSSETDDAVITLYGDKAPETGFNHLYVTVEVNGKNQKTGSVDIKPTMFMSTMNHASPVESPEFDEETSSWKGAVVFTMPSGDMGYWELTISAEIGDKTYSVTETVEIINSWKIAGVSGTNTKYFIVWVEPDSPSMSESAHLFKMYKKETMMSFPAVSGAEMTIYPYMDMGSGEGHSTNFDQPVEVSFNNYSATINYSMAGQWETTVNVIVGNDTLPEASFIYNVTSN